MEALLVSTGVVALAEIGDKTQLLALLLATRFRKPLPIVLGIFVATLANHALRERGRQLAGQCRRRRRDALDPRRCRSSPWRRGR